MPKEKCFLLARGKGLSSGRCAHGDRRDRWVTSTSEQQAIVAVLPLGAMLGALISGYLANRISRKWTKVIPGSVYFAAAIGCAFSVNVEMLNGFRFLLGISVGTASLVSPLYISEVSPPRMRGGLVSFNQLAVVSGILIAYIMDNLFKDLRTSGAGCSASPRCPERHSPSACSLCPGLRGGSCSTDKRIWRAKCLRN